tara:strand:- start:1147 stop:1845 length:699 start_codon:yes stop_codon:yes gene_type:complete
MRAFEIGDRVRWSDQYLLTFPETTVQVAQDMSALRGTVIEIWIDVVPEPWKAQRIVIVWDQSPQLSPSQVLPTDITRIETTVHGGTMKLTQQLYNLTQQALHNLAGFRSPSLTKDQQAAELGYCWDSLNQMHTLLTKELDDTPEAEELDDTPLFEETQYGMDPEYDAEPKVHDEDVEYLRKLKADWTELGGKCSECKEVDVTWDDAEDQMGQCYGCYNLGSERQWRLDDIGR